MQFITEYNTQWPRRFDELAEMLRPFLPYACALHHVGSTSIPGMPAKDIIDIDIECPIGAMASIIQALARAGYEHRGDLGVPTREAFKPSPDAALCLPPHHLYACESDSPELFRHRTFRQYLIEHEARLLWLTEQKRRADKTASTRDEYIENKTDAYNTIVIEAMAWAESLKQ
jgi:GrpB-like predicted nucleotidyltransferase (UPF0157 family)